MGRRWQSGMRKKQTKGYKKIDKEEPVAGRAFYEDLTQWEAFLLEKILPYSKNNTSLLKLTLVYVSIHGIHGNVAACKFILIAKWLDSNLAGVSLCDCQLNQHILQDNCKLPVLKKLILVQSIQITYTQTQPM